MGSPKLFPEEFNQNGRACPSGLETSFYEMGKRPAWEKDWGDNKRKR